MVEIFILLVMILPIAYCFYVLMRTFWLYRRRKISLNLIWIELGIFAIFIFYHYYLLPEKEILFLGKTIENTTDFGHGIANMAILAINYLISLGIFILTQIAFWIHVKKAPRERRKKSK